MLTKNGVEVKCACPPTRKNSETSANPAYFITLFMALPPLLRRSSTNRPHFVYSARRLVTFLFRSWPIRRSACSRPNQLNRIVSNLETVHLQLSLFSTLPG